MVLVGSYSLLKSQKQRKTIKFIFGIEEKIGLEKRKKKSPNLKGLQAADPGPLKCAAQQEKGLKERRRREKPASTLPKLDRNIIGCSADEISKGFQFINAALNDVSSIWNLHSSHHLHALILSHP